MPTPQSRIEADKLGALRMAAQLPIVHLLHLVDLVLVHDDHLLAKPLKTLLNDAAVAPGSWIHRQSFDGRSDGADLIRHLWLLV